MANTLFGSMSGVRPINWTRLIQEYVEKSLPYIGRKPSFLSAYILHLYQHHGYVNEAEEDMLTIAKDEMMYRLGPEVEMAETRTEDSSDTAVPKPPPASPPPKVRKPTSPPPRPEAGPSWEIPWKDIDLSTFEFPEAPFKHVRNELTELQNQYFRMEHITRGVNKHCATVEHKYSPGVGQADEPEKGVDPRDGEGIAGGTGGRYDPGARPEK